MAPRAVLMRTMGLAKAIQELHGRPCLWSPVSGGSGCSVRRLRALKWPNPRGAPSLDGRLQCHRGKGHRPGCDSPFPSICWRKALAHVAISQNAHCALDASSVPRWPSRSHCPCFTEASASRNRFISDRSMPRACSPTASRLPSGLLKTSMPRAQRRMPHRCFLRPALQSGR